MYRSLIKLIPLILLIVASYSSFSQSLEPEIINNKLCFDTIQSKVIAKHLIKSLAYDSVVIIARNNDVKCREIIDRYKVLHDNSMDIIDTQDLKMINLKAINKLNRRKIRSLKAQRILFIGAGLIASTFLVVIK